MRCLRRNKRILYICHEYQDGYISKFTNPEEVRVNYQPTNTDGDLIALGMDYPKYMRIKADLDMKDMFHPKDRIYLMTKPSVPFDELCEDADYEVVSDPQVSLNTIEVTLTRLSGKL